VRFAFGELGAAGMPLSLHQELVCALPELLARLEIPRGEDGPAAILVRLARPKFPVGQ
jgi:hypothetical protein